MKKTNVTRLMAVLLVLVMMVSIFTACNKQEMPEELGGKQTATTEQESPAQNKNKNETQPEIQTENQEESTENEQVDCSDEVADLQAQLDAANEAVEAANKALEEANASIIALEAENAKLVAEAEALKENGIENPFIFDEEGKPIAISLENAEKLLRVEMANNTWAYRMGEGTHIDVIDEIVLQPGKPYHEQNFELAHHAASTYVIAGVDKEGNVQVLQMVYGNKLYAYNQSWAQPKAGEGFELLETNKVFKGSEIAMAFAMAICVYEDADSEWGYSLCLATTGEYVAPVAPAPQQPEKPEIEQPEEPEEPEIPDVPDVPDVPDQPGEDEPAHNPEHNEPEYDDGDQEGEGSTPGHGDEEYDPGNQDEIPDLTDDPTEDHNDVVTDDGDNVEEGQEEIPDLTTNPIEDRNDTSTSTTTGNNDTGAAHSAPGHAVQEFDD